MPSLAMMTKITKTGLLQQHRSLTAIRREYIARRASMGRMIDEDPRMAAQRSPGLRGEWCAQQMTFETDIFASLSVHAFLE
jgi:hypothetical protein